MKDKGFTLVELLAAMVILALLMLVGVIAVSNIFDKSHASYYKTMENTLSIAGNEFFNDNRDEKPVDDYNFVDLETLVNHAYLEPLMTYDGKESCDSNSGVYLYNYDGENVYETCLICGGYQSNGEFCKGMKFGTISITANINTANGPNYNPLLSYARTKWINATTIYVHFNLVPKEGETFNVTEYRIYNSSTNNIFTKCTGGNSCTSTISTSGSYYVEAYDGETKVANRKYFNIKIDNSPPTYEILNTETEYELKNNEVTYDYENEVINIKDDNGYSEVKYTLRRYNQNGKKEVYERYDQDGNVIERYENVDLKSKDLKIRLGLASGKYELEIIVKDFAGNTGRCINTESNTIEFTIKYKVALQYTDNKENKHNVGEIKVYTDGRYDDLPGSVKIYDDSPPQPVVWYISSNLVGNSVSNTSIVEKDGYHTLYGREEKMKTAFTATCNKNLVYKGQDTPQALATIPEGEQGKYRLVVYYNDKLLAYDQVVDARKYTVIALLNDGYTWTDGSKKAKKINKECEILPYKVTKPTCNDLTYDKDSYPILLSAVNDSGTYSIFGETAISVEEIDGTFAPAPVKGHDAGNYKMRISLAGNKNFSWDVSSNYNFSSITRTCEIKRKPVEYDPSSAWCNKNVVYNGKDNRILLNSAYYSEGNTGLAYGMRENDELVYIISLSNSNGNSNRRGHVMDAGTYTFHAISEPNYLFANGGHTASFDCEIKSAPLRIQIKNKSKIYDGTELKANHGDVVVDGLFQFQGHKERLTFTLDGGQTIVGSSESSIKSFINEDGCQKCYYIQKEKKGKLTVKVRPLTITAESCSKNYNGEELICDKHTEGGYGLAQDHEFSSINVDPGKRTKLGTSINTVKNVAISHNGDVTSNYDISIVNGEIEIYDNEAPTCTGITVSEKGKITAKAKDNWGFNESGSKKTKTTKQDAVVGKNKVEFIDYKGNKGECKITVEKVKQQRTYSCDKHDTCQDSSCGTTNPYCGASGSGGTEKVECSSQNGDNWETINSTDICQNKSCDTAPCYLCSNWHKSQTASCENNNCDCKTWSETPSSWLDDADCTESETKTTKTECRTIYREVFIKD